MAQNTDTHGETKSSPQEIAKLPMATCDACGLRAVAPTVVHDRCTNVAACGKRQRRRAEGKR